MKKGQVTVFIILGLVILFVSLFLLALSSKVKTGQQEAEREETLSGLFQQEAFRLFVESCLQPELEQGILLLGQQGRLWDDQPGGRHQFRNGETGIQLDTGERVFYAITKESYVPHEERYPCNQDDGENDPPFCKYFYPSLINPLGKPKLTKIGFGKIQQFRTSNIVGDLQRYLQEQTISCVQQFLRDRVSQDAEVETRDAQVLLKMLDNSISVHVDYPISFRVGENSFFHFSSFDLFYPSKLGQFLNTALIFALERDQKYVDFSFRQETLIGDAFGYQTETLGRQTQTIPADRYKELSARLEVTPLLNGDDLLRFTLPEQTILNRPGEFTYQIARQNRPPALNYISQCPAEGYDYLVVKGLSTPLGKVDFTLEAHDPDEEDVAIYAVNSPYSDFPDVDEDISSDRFLLSNTNPGLRNLEQNIYHLTARADDSSATDSQDVRIRVDEKIEPKVIFRNLLQPDKENQISIEDPFCIEKQRANLPSEREEPPFLFATPYGTSTMMVTLNTGQNAIPPYQNVDCDHPESYDFNTVKSDNSAFLSLYGDLTSFPATVNFYAQGDVVYDTTDLALCGYTAVAAAQVRVDACTPPREDPLFPYPYIPDHPKLSELYKKDSSGETHDRNHFDAVRSCCTTQGTVKPSATPCYPNGIEGCFTNDYQLETVIPLCDGQRGNVCGGEQQITAQMQNGHLVCGENNLPGCEGVDDLCVRKPEYSVILHQGWCGGITKNNGCDQACASEMVHEGPLLNQNPTDNPDQFFCGCPANPLASTTYFCDTNFDQNWGVCELRFGIIPHCAD